MRKISIIGTAGRQDDASRISQDLYDAMYDQTLKAIEDWGCDTGVSGGAAVADHLAVRAYLDGKLESLILYLPAYFENGAYIPNPRVQFNPGKTSNQYHQQFSRSCGVDSLAELDAAIKKGAVVRVYEGFKRRNLEVAADCDAMLALTFGTNKEFIDITSKDPGFQNSNAAGLKDGGTAHTWGECWKADVKRHVNLHQLSRELRPNLFSNI